MIPPDSGSDSSAPSASVAPSSAPSVVPANPVSSVEPVPTQSSTPQPTPSSPAPRPTRTRSPSTTEQPVIQSPVAAPPSPPPPPPTVESPPVESATFQIVPQSTKATSQPPSQDPSPSFWISANSPTPAPSSKQSVSLALASPSSSQSRQQQQQQSTTFKTVTNTPSPLGTAPASTSNFPSRPSKSPDPTIGKGSGVIASSPFGVPSGQAAPKAKKNDASTIGGVIGGLAAFILLGLLLFFLWKWRDRRRALANRRLSFGPYGNGIDASTGSVLVASVARPEDGSPIEPISKDDICSYVRRTYN
jgi:hypothetical protein